MDNADRGAHERRYIRSARIGAVGLFVLGIFIILICFALAFEVIRGPSWPVFEALHEMDWEAITVIVLGLGFCPASMWAVARLSATLYEIVPTFLLIASFEGTWLFCGLSLLFLTHRVFKGEFWACRIGFWVCGIDSLIYLYVSVVLFRELLDMNFAACFFGIPLRVIFLYHLYDARRGCKDN